MQLLSPLFGIYAQDCLPNVDIEGKVLRCKISILINDPKHVSPIFENFEESGGEF